MDKKNLVEEQVDSGFDSLGLSVEKLHLDDVDSNGGKGSKVEREGYLGKSAADGENPKSSDIKKEETEHVGTACLGDSGESEDVGVCLTQDDDGDSILHLTICNGNEDFALKVIDNVNLESINEPNYLGQTPLFLAVAVRMRSVIRKLIDVGADIESCDVNGNTIIHIAAESGSDDSLTEIFTYTPHRNLQEFSSSLQTLIESKNYEGFTPLHLAARNKKIKTAELLCRVGANADEMDLKAGFTALHHVVLTNNVNLVHEFIESCSPDVNAVSYSGATPLHLAMSENSEPIADMLIMSGADTSRETIEGLSWDNPRADMLIPAW